LRLVNRDFDIASQKLQQNLNSFRCRQQSCHYRLESLERSFCNLDSLTDFKLTVERNDLIAGRAKRVERRWIDCGHMVPKAHEARDSMRMNHAPVKFSVNKFCEQVARKHGFHEPDRATGGQFPKSNTWGYKLDLELTVESCSR
jgi:hypothetical protein